MSLKALHLALPAAAALLLIGCSDVEDPHDHHDHDHEFMNMVLLEVVDSQGASQEVIWEDLMDGSDPLIDTLALQAGESYTVSISFLNSLEEPYEDLTPEIRDEGQEHQVLIYGTGVSSPASDGEDPVLVEVSYLDQDEAGMDLGLEHQVDALADGSGTFQVILRHMPLEDGQSVKTSSTAADFAEGGSGAIPGGNDVDVSFPLVIEL